MEHCDSVSMPLSDLVEAANREARSEHAHRLVDYLLVNEAVFTHEVARDCAIGNISCAANFIRPTLERRGLSIVAKSPDTPIRNRYGDPSGVHEWRWVRLR